MAMPVPHGLMTVEEYDALPEDNSARYELQEGVLIVSPRPLRKHQRAVIRLAAQLEQQLPDHWEALADFEVLVRGDDPATIRAPDVVVVPVDGSENRVPASEAVLAVEIISPGSRNVDRYLKPVEYADAGIPHYWLVDLDPPVPSITTFGLGAPGDGYVESQTATRELVVTEPFPLRIDIDALVSRR
ncbi:Uma2 family endonuclease [Pseudonocardia nigra]|uniref:Uma2 family endonuclease n=1 Tax=Pseudonocardia nigra TaxID=1921578 RepID=UPI001FECE4C6|nr:Uma2 family endonuclease [Pseudonocardia nigra]